MIQGTKPLPDWYSYGQIRFTGVQVRWVLENLQTLEDGQWPSEGKETGYTGATSNQLRAEGRHVSPALIAAEVTLRLGQCGDDGFYCIAFYRDQAEIHVLVRHYHCGEDEVRQHFKRAIWYASGRCRRWMPCNHCRLNCWQDGRAPETYDQWWNRNRSGPPFARVRRGSRSTV